MLATIDVGSNTVRMLLGHTRNGRVYPEQSFRQITRLGGSFDEEKGLAKASMQRTLDALTAYKSLLLQHRVEKLRIVGTAALRRATNKHQFIENVKKQTGFDLEVITGSEEARLTTAGVLSVIDPLPETAFIIDIGGGSTEFICYASTRILWQESYPLGVVRLYEECAGQQKVREQISLLLDHVMLDSSKHITAAQMQSCQLIGTAGTITTLSALKMQMLEYDWRRVNNSQLSLTWLQEIRATLQNLSCAERENLPGMEIGRGDLILPGTDLLIALMQRLHLATITVADAGLLEGVMLEL